MCRACIGGVGAFSVVLLRPMCMACIGGVGAFSVVLLRPMCMACIGGVGAFSVVLLLRPMWRTTLDLQPRPRSKMNISSSGHWVTRMGFRESISLWTYVILYDWKNDMVQKKASVYHWSHLFLSFSCQHFYMSLLHSIVGRNSEIRKYYFIYCWKKFGFYLKKNFVVGL